jgi:hypothetical protein
MLGGLSVTAWLENSPFIGLQVLQNRTLFWRVEGITGCENITFDESTVALVGEGVFPMVDIEVNIGVNSGMTVVVFGVLKERWLRFLGEFFLKQDGGYPS